MKELSTLIALLMITPLLFGQNATLQQYIPKDKTVFVANITPYKTYKSLDTATTNKLNISELLAPMMLQMAGGDMSEDNINKVKEDLSSPEKAGLDIQKEIYIWVQKTELAEDEESTGYQPNNMIVNLVMPITDGAKFRTFLDNIFGLDKTKSMIPSGDAMNMIHDGMLINWNKNRLVLATSTVQYNFWDDKEQFDARNKKMLYQHANNLSKVTADNSIVKDADFQKHLNKDADFGVWVEYSKIILDQPFPREVQFLEEAMKELVGGMKMGGNGFVKKGSADFFLKVYNSEMMSRVLAESYKLTLNKDFFKYIDNSNLMGVYSFAMSPQSAMESYGKELYRVLEKSKEGLMITNVLDIIDIFVDEDEIYTLLKGDMLMAVTDLKVIEKKSTDFEYNEESDKWEEVSEIKKEMIPVMSLMMSYGSEENIMKFVKLAANAGVISKTAEGVWTVGGVKEEVGFDVFIIVKNGVLMFTNDENIANNVDAGIAKNKQMDAKEIKDITSYIQYAFVDAGKITGTLKSAYKSMDKVLPMDLDEIEKAVKRFEIKTHHPKGNEILTEFHLIMGDPNANVLQTMLDGVMKAMQSKSRDSGEFDGIDEIEIEEKDNGDGTKKL